MAKDGAGGTCCGSETEVKYRTSPLEKAITEAMAKLGIEDSQGEVELWNAIENETFKILIVHKGVMNAAGFTDASVMLHKDEVKESKGENE